MKVIHINTERTWRGGENQLRLLLEGLPAYGVENHCLFRTGSAAHLRLSSLGQVTTFATGPLNVLPIAIWLSKYCKKNRIELIAAHDSVGHNLGLLVKLLISHIRLVVHRRIDNEPKNNPYHRFKYLNCNVSRYIAVSKKISEVLAQYGINPLKIDVVYSGVNVDAKLPFVQSSDKANFLHALNLDPDALWIGNASALTREKGWDELLTAFRLLKNNGLHFQGLIAGDGPLKYDIANQIKRYELEREVRLLGFLEDPKPLLRALDILVLPSHNEGLGSVLLDAIAANCTLIGSRVGGIPEIIEHEKTGYLINPGSPSDIVRYVTLVKDNPKKAQNLRKNALLLLEEQFQSASTVEKTYDIYRDVLSH